MGDEDIHFSNGKLAYKAIFKELYFKNGKKAYSGGDVFYSNGVRAYHGIFNQAFYSNGNKFAKSGAAKVMELGVSMNLRDKVDSFKLDLGEDFGARIDIGENPRFKQISFLINGDESFTVND